MAPDGGRERGVVVGVEVVEQVGEGLGPGPRGVRRAPRARPAVTVTSTPRRSTGSGARSTRPPAASLPTSPVIAGCVTPWVSASSVMRRAPLAFEVGECRGGHHAQPATRGQPRQQGDEPVELGGQLEAVDREHG